MSDEDVKYERRAVLKSSVATLAGGIALTGSATAKEDPHVVALRGTHEDPISPGAVFDAIEDESKTVTANASKELDDFHENLETNSGDLVAFNFVDHGDTTSVYEARVSPTRITKKGKNVSSQSEDSRSDLVSAKHEEADERAEEMAQRTVQSHQDDDWRVSNYDLDWEGDDRDVLYKLYNTEYDGADTDDDVRAVYTRLDQSTGWNGGDILRDQTSTHSYEHYNTELEDWAPAGGESSGGTITVSAPAGVSYSRDVDFNSAYVVDESDFNDGVARADIDWDWFTPSRLRVWNASLAVVDPMDFWTFGSVEFDGGFGSPWESVNLSASMFLNPDSRL